MARALLGHIGTTQDPMLALEVARLRRRVAELESEVVRLRALTAHADATIETSVDIDLELHRITETPVLA